MGKPPVATERITARIAARIASGTYEPGEWLPTTTTLAAELGTSRMTVIRAIRALADRGRVEIHKGRGAKVAMQRTPITRTAADQTEGSGPWRGFLAAAHRVGKEPYTVALSVGEVGAPPEVAEQMGVPAGTAVLRRARIQGTVEDGRQIPGLLSTTWIRLGVVERIPDLRQQPGTLVPMRDLMRRVGLELHYVERPFPRLANSDEREYLELGEMECIYDVWRVCSDQMDQVIDVTRMIVDPRFAQLEYRYP